VICLACRARFRPAMAGFSCAVVDLLPGGLKAGDPAAKLDWRDWRIAQLSFARRRRRLRSERLATGAAAPTCGEKWVEGTQQDHERCEHDASNSTRFSAAVGAGEDRSGVRRLKAFQPGPGLQLARRRNENPRPVIAELERGLDGDEMPVGDLRRKPACAECTGENGGFGSPRGKVSRLLTMPDPVETGSRRPAGGFLCAPRRAPDQDIGRPRRESPDRR